MRARLTGDLDSPALLRVDPLSSNVRLRAHKRRILETKLPHLPSQPCTRKHPHAPARTAEVDAILYLKSECRGTNRVLRRGAARAGESLRARGIARGRVAV